MTHGLYPLLMDGYGVFRRHFDRKMLFLPFILKQVIDHAFELSKRHLRDYADDRRSPGPGPGQQQ
jgi:hypothetical protein